VKVSVRGPLLCGSAKESSQHTTVKRQKFPAHLIGYQGVEKIPAKTTPIPIDTHTHTHTLTQTVIKDFSQEDSS